jgi:hypothetical protein
VKSIVIQEKHGQHGGQVQHFGTASPSMGNRWDSIVISLSGIAAEQRLCGSLFSATAKSDLLRSLETARLLMEDEALRGCSTVPPWPHHEVAGTDVSDVASMYTEPLTSRENGILRMCFRRAVWIVRTHEERVIPLAEAVIAKGTLTEDDVRAILGERPITLFGTRRGT